jgi:hypothetical protein
MMESACFSDILEVIVNTLKPNGNYIYHFLCGNQSVFCIYGFRMNLDLNSINQVIFVMLKCGVLFEVRTEFLNSI